MTGLNDGYVRVLDGALAAMVNRPTPLDAALKFTSQWEKPENKIDSSSALLTLLQASDVNDALPRILAKRVRSWDYAAPNGWTDQRNTRERRDAIYEGLSLNDAFRAWCDEAIPIYEPSEPLVVISSEYIDWYHPEAPGTDRFYWNAYTTYLEQVAGWKPESLLDLDRSTSAIVERLANPTSQEARQTKGLVVGYVQSGKTANFTGVVAKAADAGYRLFIILAGTLDILRNQTQRRLDKELIGRELLEHDYDDDDAYPDGFVAHTARPALLGAFDFERLTRPGEDFQGLGAGIAALRFDKLHPEKSLYDMSNLRQQTARLLVIKKNRSIIEKVVGNLRTVGEAVPLGEIPTLIIDDESDQASLNTRRPTLTQARQRTAINSAITQLLQLLPRAQYVGYTATPFANVFVDPDDVDDLFPGDYLIPLPRPSEYMGVADFHDLDGSDSDDRFESNEGALVRDVSGLDTKEPNLPKAVDAFVLSGAIKLWRSEHDLTLKFKHHTMLVHVSQRRDAQRAMAERLEEIWTRSGYEGGAGLDRLRLLWETDYEPVMRRRAPHSLVPTSFDELRPQLGRCLSLIDEGEKRILIVNSDNKSDDPDFDRERVWKILVGGAKLSRGYTVEGLTISYYRRRAEAADTMMQMGRWFGFRQGYGDLVRLFIGREEPLPKGQGTIDLYLAFEGVCRDEMDFRRELQKYALPKYGGKGIRPAQVPPLVSAHVLRPTASNKMYNAEIQFQNLSGDYIERTLAPPEQQSMLHNQTIARTLIETMDVAGIQDLEYSMDGKAEKVIGFVGVAEHDAGLRFLSDYQWTDHKPVLQRVIDFVAQRRSDESRILRWLILAPQYRTDLPDWVCGSLSLSVARRSRAETKGRYKVYSTPRDRRLVKALVGLDEGLATLGPTAAQWKTKDQAVLLLYPVRDPVKEPDDVTTIGFALQFPINEIPIPITFGVRVKSQPDAVVVSKTD